MKRGVGLQAHAANVWIQFSQAPRCPYKSAARAQARDEVGDAAGSLLPDFIRGRTVMGLPVGGIAVLVGVKVFSRIGGHDFVDFANRAVGTLVAWGDDQLRTVGRQDALAFMRSTIR